MMASREAKRVADERGYRPQYVHVNVVNISA